MSSHHRKAIGGSDHFHRIILVHPHRSLIRQTGKWKRDRGHLSRGPAPSRVLWTSVLCLLCVTVPTRHWEPGVGGGWLEGAGVNAGFTRRAGRGPGPARAKRSISD